MPGALWLVAAVVLAVVIGLLLRGQGSGRNRVPAVEYTPEPDPEPAISAPTVTEHTLVREPEPFAAHDARAERSEERAELAEDAALRHDEGYVEVVGERDPEEAPTGVPGGWRVKGNADSLLYYTPDAPQFERAAADVWFESEQAARSAGFTRWDAHRR